MIKQEIFENIYKQKNKKKTFNWDKDKQYININSYNEEMHNISIHSESKYDIDKDIFKEMEDSSYSPEEKIYFVKDFFFKNFKGGKGNYCKGVRYLKI